jgi:transcriptional regulator with XRE-family HTH domain
VRARGKVAAGAVGCAGINRRLTSSFELVGPVVGRFEGDSNAKQATTREATGASMVPAADHMESDRYCGKSSCMDLGSLAEVSRNPKEMHDAPLPSVHSKSERARMINEALKLIRLYWGKSQAEMAEELKLSQPYLSEIERGRKEVTLDVLQRYSGRFSIPMSSLMLFAERIEGQPKPSRGRILVAGKTLSFLKKLMPDHAQEDQA